MAVLEKIAQMNASVDLKAAEASCPGVKLVCHDY
jgi:hypothetical protein